MTNEAVGTASDHDDTAKKFNEIEAMRMTETIKAGETGAIENS